MPKKIESDFFIMTCKNLGLFEFIPEYKFHPTRKWRIDYADPFIKLGVEIQGAVWTIGRHNRPTGYIKDMEKFNAMNELGWHLLLYQPKKIDFDQILRTYNNLKHGIQNGKTSE